MAGNSRSWKNVIEETIASNKQSLHDIARFLWRNPESSFNESQAHDYLCDYLTKKGFSVEKNFVAATGFRATFQSPVANDGGGDEKLPHVCFLCEYDATAEVGHAAGHNLKTEGSIAAAISIKECIEKGLFRGKVTILGTPGEDCGSGTKINMVNEGTFSGIDFCLMLSPFNQNILCPKFYTLLVVTVSYKGKAAHASAFPWEGRNALDAAVACYNNIGLLRQQLKPTWSINGIILNGGIQPNVIPEYAQMKFWLRAPNHKDLVIIQQKCTACFVAAAKATSCEASFDFEDTPYYPMSHNSKMSEIYKDIAQARGIEFSEQYQVLESHVGSTDFGNVSQVVPCILPAINVGGRSHIHSVEFCEASGSDEAMETTLNAATALAITAAEILSSSALMESIKAEHNEKHGQRTQVALQRMRSYPSAT